MAREGFNWSALDRSALYSMLYKLKSEIVGQRLTVGEISKLLAYSDQRKKKQDCSSWQGRDMDRWRILFRSRSSKEKTFY
jgi:hypothetical protein